jgi:hypothetical protein
MHHVKAPLTKTISSSLAPSLAHLAPSLAHLAPSLTHLAPSLAHLAPSLSLTRSFSLLQCRQFNGIEPCH